MPIERRRKLSEARMAKRGFRRVSGGQECPERTSCEMAWAWHRRLGNEPGPFSIFVLFVPSW